jgi:hypothetical protein
MNTNATDALDMVVGLLIAAGLFWAVGLPAWIGHLRERRIDRQLRAAESGRRAEPRRPASPAAAPEPSVTHRPVAAAGNR